MLAQEVDISSAVTQKTGLNGIIWEKGGHLKKEIRDDLVSLAKEFYKFLELEYPIKDIYFTGSLANYNWTNHSDIDIHIIFDLKEENDLLSSYILAKKEIWSQKHNITIHGFPVELFAKNEETILEYKSIYSLLNDTWVKKPIKNDKELDIKTIQTKADALADKIDALDHMDNDDDKYEVAEDIKEKLMKMRQAGLEEGGEFSTENIIYKVLRNSGYLEKLKDLKTKAFDKKYTIQETPVTINEAKEIVKSNKYDYGCLMLYVKYNDWASIINQISKEDIYDVPGFGLETDPHTTLLFGFHDDEVKVNDIINVAKKYINKQIPVKVTGVSIFPASEGRPYDVVKFDVKNETMSKCNEALRKFPHTSSFPDYKPHITIAYVLPGKGESSF